MNSKLQLHRLHRGLIPSPIWNMAGTETHSQGQLSSCLTGGKGRGALGGGVEEDLGNNWRAGLVEARAR